MVVEARRLPYETLARAAERLAGGAHLPDALDLLATAVADGTGAAVAVVRVLDEPSGLFVARAIAPSGSLLAAEVSGSRRSLDDLFDGRRNGRTLVFPAVVNGRVVGAIELVSPADGLDGESR